VKKIVIFDEDLSGVFVSTPEGKLKACNPAYARLMEYDSVEDLLASSAIEHYDKPQDRADFLNLLREKKQLIDYEGTLVTKKGKHINTLENIVYV
jgi:PAS domain-containing protein